VLPNFMAQFGIAADPQVNAKWKDANLQDDPVKQSNKRGMVTFAKTSLPNSRSTQLFINTGNNARLDSDGFAPIGQVTSGMEVVDQFYNGYGEGAPEGRGPDQSEANAQGNAYLEKDFPQLDFIKKATIQ
jgi:peptidyl-prolyl cis-trans isomerase A (cyclophilin A)